VPSTHHHLLSAAAKRWWSFLLPQEQRRSVEDASAAASIAKSAKMRQLASKVVWNESLGRATSVIVPLNEGGNAPPLYCVHSLSGKATDFTQLAWLLGPEQPSFGIQIPMRNRNAEFGGSVTSISIESIAQYYVSALVNFQPSGPLALAGWSMGTLIALEMAQILRAQGREVVLLVAFDHLPQITETDRIPRNLQYLGKLAFNVLPWLVCHKLIKTWSFRTFANRAFEKGAQIANRLLSRRQGDGIVRGFLVADFLNTSKYSPEHTALMQKILDATVRYKPEKYEGKVQVYVARTEVSLTHFPEMKTKWRELAPSSQILSAAGTHRSMIEDPNGRKLARDLRQRLARCSSETWRHVQV
jgi:thioesterase domain-containing protein